MMKKLAAIVGVFFILIIQVVMFQTIDFYKVQLEDTSQQLQESVNEIFRLQIEALQLVEFINKGEFSFVEIKTVEATGYAPLDPNAVEGMCFQGNPNVTASGEATYPNLSIAAPPEIPFGTWVWIDELGWRRVDDRGGRIKGDKIDICFTTKREALEWGKRKLTMIIPHWEPNGELQF